MKNALGSAGSRPAPHGNTTDKMSHLAQCPSAESAALDARLFQAMFDLSGVGIAQTDPVTGRFLRVNHKYTEITGYSAAQLLQKSFLDITHPDERAACRLHLERMLTGQMGSWEGDKRYVRKDGVTVWVHLTAKLLFDALGQPLASISIAHDITDRVRAQEALRDSERELGAIFELAGSGKSVTRVSDGRLVRVNQRQCELTGYTEAELLQRNFLDIVHPADRATGRQIYADMVAGTREEVQREERYLRRDGTVRWVLVTARLMRDAQARPLYIVATAQDIDERRRAEDALRVSEERLRLAAQAASFGTYDLNLKTGEVFVSPELKALAGLPHDADLRFDSRRCLDIVHPADRSRVRAAIHDALHPSTSGDFVREYRIVRAGGGVRWIMERGRVFFEGEAGQRTAVRIIGVLLDISAHKRAEDALRESEERYRRMVETANEGIWVIDRQARTQLANHRMAEILACTVEDVQRRGVLEFVFEEDRAGIQRRIDANLGGTSEQFDFRFRRLDGSAAHLLGCTSAVTNAEGRVVGALGMFTDISQRKRAEEALLESQARWKSLFHHAPFPVWEEDFSAIQARFEALRATGVEDLARHLEAHPEEIAQLAALVRIVDISRSTADTFGVSSAADLSRRLPEYFAAESLAVFAREMVALWNGETAFSAEIPIRHPAGGSRLLELHLSVVPGCEQSLARVLVSFVDITQRKRAEEAIRRREQEFRALAERSLDVVARIDRDFRYRYVNPAIEETIGQPATAFLNKTIFELELPATVELLWTEQLRAVLATGEDRRFTFSYEGANGKKRVFDTRLVPEFGADGQAESVISVTREITRLHDAEEQARQTVQQLETVNALLAAQSRTDSLTGLANRRHLFDYLEREWRRETRHGHGIALIIADIDFFKAYNDCYGHLAGDQCLRRVAEALGAQVRRPGDLLARYGGEEFVVVLPETSLQGACELAKAMRQAVADLDLEHAGSAVANHVTISLGVAELSPKGRKTKELFRQADAALYQAKEKGRNRTVCAR